jgi:hypothetical protein
MESRAESTDKAEDKTGSGLVSAHAETMANPGVRDCTSPVGSYGTLTGWNPEG